MNIQVGRTYRAKKPANCGGLFNDRQVLYIGIGIVQYDGPAIPLGGKYRVVTREAFEKWAGEDITEKLPSGEWEPWKRKS